MFNLCAHATIGSNYPKSAKTQREDKVGSILGTDNTRDNEGGLKIFGDSLTKKNPDAIKNSIGVNAYLWKSSLEVVSFMPISITDPASGVITTDWLEDQNGKGERHKVNVLVKSSELNASNIKVTVFKQVLKDRIWRDVKASEEISHDLEEKILTRARALKMAQEH